jgi:DNA-binding CsgD family transcriptional regulator
MISSGLKRRTAGTTTCDHASRYAPCPEPGGIEARLNSALDSLSPREKTIAKPFAVGQSYKQIAAQLGLSPATVRHHLRSIYTKANISNKSALAGLLK